MKAAKGKPAPGAGGVQAGQRPLPAKRPKQMKPVNKTSLTATRRFCPLTEAFRPAACRAVSATIRPAPVQRGSREGERVRAKAPAARASTATGAEKPTRSEAQQAA